MKVKVTEQITIGNSLPLVFIAGPCAIESREHALEVAAALKGMAQKAGVPLIYKSSYDKANRSSATSYRGVGIAEGLDILREVRERLNLAVITDVHSPEQAAKAALCVDMLQIPAFLCRQTDLIIAAAQTGKPINIKKGQFIAPAELTGVIEKAYAAENHSICLCERGSFFGYHDLVADMRSLAIMKGLGCPVVFDATHSVQHPGALNGRSGGQREFVWPLARAAVAIGIAAVFIETHENPDAAPCDGPNMVPLKQMPDIFASLKRLDHVVKEELCV